MLRFDSTRPPSSVNSASGFAASRSRAACRKTFPNHYVKINALDSTHGWESLRLSFIVNRPKVEPGFELRREEAGGRTQRYSARSYASVKPEGERYK